MMDLILVTPGWRQVLVLLIRRQTSGCWQESRNGKTLIISASFNNKYVIVVFLSYIVLERRASDALSLDEQMCEYLSLFITKVDLWFELLLISAKVVDMPPWIYFCSAHISTPEKVFWCGDLPKLAENNIHYNQLKRGSISSKMI